MPRCDESQLLNADQHWWAYCRDNLSFNKPAAQGGTYNGQSASLAVDSALTGTCAFSDNGDRGQPAWWQVDLQTDCYVASVTIKLPNTTDCQYAQGFVIIVSDDSSASSSTTLCYYFNNGTDQGHGDTVTLRGLCPTFTCATPLVGRYVTIRRQGGYQTKSMSFCDVQVNGIPTEVATGKPARQSPETYDTLGADYAVDGNLSTCSTTVASLDNSTAWWQVDLGDVYTITNVTVQAASAFDDAQYLTGFVVAVSLLNDTNQFWLCGSYRATVAPGSQLTVSCKPAAVGRFVTIKRDGGSFPNKLTLCEVRVLVAYADSNAAETRNIEASTSFVPNVVPTSSAVLSTTEPTLFSSTSSSSVSSKIVDSSKTGLIVGVVIGSVLLVIIIVSVIAATVVIRRRNKEVAATSSVTVVNNSLHITTEDKTYASLDPASREPIHTLDSLAPDYEKLKTSPINEVANYVVVRN